MRTIILLLSVTLVAVCSGQSDGRYRPFGSAQARPFGSPNSGTFSPGQYRPDAARYKPKANNDGRYTGNDGRYTGGNDGRYNGGDDGRYRPDDSGKYSGKYVHDGRDADKYKHVDVPYKAGKDDISKYVGDKDKYVGGGQYKDKNQGSGSGAGKQKGSGSGSGSGANAGSNQGVGAQIPGTGLKPPGFGGNSGVNSGANPGPGGKPNTGNVHSGFGNNAGSKLGSGAGVRGVGTNTGSGNGKGIGAPNGFGVPKPLKKGNSAGFYDNRNYGIIRKVEKVETDGYHYLYETENGITGEEQGKLHNRGTDDEGMKANGFYTYTGPDNVVYTVNYTADERGFLPEADHIPTTPPVPPLIARMLDWQRQQGLIE